MKVKREHRSKFSNLSNWKEEAWKYQGFKGTKLENLLRWSLFTFIYNRSTNMNYFIYILHIISLHGKIWIQQNDLAPNVWLHSLVGRASHRNRGGHGFESRWSPDIFRLLLSNCSNSKIYWDDHSSLSTFFTSEQSSRTRESNSSSRYNTVQKHSVQCTVAAVSIVVLIAVFFVGPIRFPRNWK